jgi:phage terminase large subunit
LTCRRSWLNTLIELAGAFRELATPARFKIYYGGRGSGKSWHFARHLLLKGLNEPLRVLCAREFQVSIKDSVHRLLADQIEQMELGAFYQVKNNEIVGLNDTLFIFEGLRHNITKVKSMEGIDVCWVEEAERVSDDSWKVLIPTIRKPGSEIWISFNPEQETDPTFTRFVKNPPPDSIVKKVGWEDNKWFPEELKKQMEYDYKVDPDSAAHIWGGECKKISDAQVLKGKFVIEAFEAQSDWQGPYCGADWGFSKDPTTLIKLYIHERRLYVAEEAYGVGVEITETPALFDSVGNARKITIRADSARPETISYMRRQGFNIVAAKKGPGSVEDGVQHLRGYEKIVIHPRCKYTAAEARLWSYKVDKLSGDVLPVLVDANNHCMDAIRYGLEPIMKPTKLVMEWA